MIFRKDIQGLRGLAVILVILYHINQKKISGGFIGVDIFFVISGYLVCSSIENLIAINRKKFFIKFYSGRIRRLFPSSLFTVIIVSLYIYLYNTNYYPIYVKDATFSLCFLSNYYFYYNKIDYFHRSLNISPLLHYWSLSLEEQFYFFSPLLIYTFFGKLTTLYVILIISSFAVCFYYGLNDKDKGYFFLSSRIWELVAGSISRYFKQIVNRIIFNIDVIILLIVILSIKYNSDMVYPSYYALFPVLLSIYLLNSTSKKKLLDNRIICYIGNISYSLYLIHFPLKYIISTSLEEYLLMLILIVLFLHNIIEMPFYRGIFKTSDNTTLVFCFIMFLMTLIFLYASNRKAVTLLRNNHLIDKNSLIEENIKGMKSYCCFYSYSERYPSTILFMGDSHINQYIVALFESKYKYFYQLVHIYVHSESYKMIYNSNTYFKDLSNYYFNLCIFGNEIVGDDSNLYIQKMAVNMLPICNQVLLSNDNPRHTVDPNSCINKNIDECFGELNKTCFIPNKFIPTNNSKINIVTLWNEDIIKEKRCLYFYQHIPIYSDIHHLSILYLKFIITNIIAIISNYIKYDKRYKYNDNCKYYLIPTTKFLYPNLHNKRCNK